MPRAYVENTNVVPSEKLEWKKLANLKAGSSYKIVKTLEKIKSYDDSTPKLVVYLELTDGIETFMITGNKKLKQQLEGSHVNGLSEGWVLDIGKTSTVESKQYGSYNVVEIELRCVHSMGGHSVLEDDCIPF